MLIWQAHKGKIESAAFSPDGQLFVTATGGAKTPYFWEPTSGKLVRKLEGSPGLVQTVAFAPDAPLFAAGSREGVTVWQTDTWEVVSRLAFGSSVDLTFSPGPNPTLAAGGSIELVFWTDAGSPHSGKPRFPDGKYPIPRDYAALHFSPDGTLLATSTISTGQLWRTSDQKLERITRTAPTNSRGAVRFSPDGSKVAFAYARTVEVWPTADEPGPLVKFAAAQGRLVIWAVHWTSDGKSLLTAGNDGCVRMWDASNGAELKTFEWNIGKLYCAAFSPDGLTCAACSAKGQIVVWDVDV